MTKITILQLQLSQDPYQELQEAFQPNPTGKKTLKIRFKDSSHSWHMMK